MDADPWADAPSSSRPSTPAQISSPSDPSKPTFSSPLARDTEHADPSTDDSPPPASRSPSPPAQALASEFPAEDEDPFDSPFEATPAAAAPETSAAEDDGFDDFDEFDETAQAGPSGTANAANDDAFGDFGDFEEGDFEEVQAGTGGEGVAEPEPVPEQRWHALRLDPLPSKGEMVDQLTELMAPVWDGGGELGDEPVRQVGGLGQIMVSESSREAYAQLTTPPMLKTLDWTRSRVRREHLISMGVPVNLDEVDSHRLSSLPPLRITTNIPTTAQSSSAHRASADSYHSADKGKGKESNSASQSVPVSAVTNGDDRKQKEKYGLGSKPLLDSTKAEDLCGIEEEQLSILSLERLKAIQEELVQTSAQASALLAWHLQYKDAQAQDSATYNGMISELIANAAKAKSAQSAGSGGVFKRSSIRRPQSGSPGITPRTGSPAMR